MRHLTGIILALLTSTVSYAYDYQYYLGLKGGLTTLTGGDSARFTLQDSYGASFGYRFKDRWLIDFDLSYRRNYNDTTAGTIFAIGGNKDDATQRWKATRLGLSLKHLLFSSENKVNLSLGLGGGLMMWKIVDPVSDTTLSVSGVHHETADFAAPEIFLSGAGGVGVFLSPSWSVNWDFHADYLSGAGAEFEASVKSSRDRWQVGSFLSLSYHFGDITAKAGWRSDKSWSSAGVRTLDTDPRALDSDGDGVPDDLDRCLSTPAGAVVDGHGCSVDSDGDGVSDGLDDCPNTERRAAGMVDIFGCPVDSDFDGVPDYLDSCPFNRVGAHVDENGCPVDSDADGVPDGLDDCPNTLFGVDVDQFGCIDLSMLAQPMILNIDYPPGSFEIDPNNRERIKDLARLLSFVPDIRLEIDGYTDNIGTTVANKKLSEKRARRVRDYLVSLEVDPDRIKVFGKGETNFVASNQTAEGRAKNRRIEIIFYM